MLSKCNTLALLLVFMLAAGGCSSKDKPVIVEGVVTLDGQRLPGATVTFVPDREGRRPASGRTDDDGTFELTTFHPGDGALPGTYKVTVSKAVEEAAPEETQEKGLTGKKILYGAAKSPKGKKSLAAKAAASPVPAMYRDTMKTPLSQTVPAKEKVRIELYSKAR
jgi:hypothetical protein